MENLSWSYSAIPADPPASNKPPAERVAQLIRKRCLLKCIMNGYAVTALFDTGAQVSLIDQTWRQKIRAELEGPSIEGVDGGM